MIYENQNTNRRRRGAGQAQPMGRSASDKRVSASGAAAGGGNASSRVGDYLEAGAARLRAWQDEHLSVESQNGLKPELQTTSFPPAPRDLRALLVRKGLGGAHRP
jgi:hypothetical protein